MNDQRYPSGVGQAAPEYLDLAASVDKAVGLIELAAQEGARLLAFPEVWLPGYPWWIWLDDQERPELAQRYLEQAFQHNSAAAQAIGLPIIAHKKKKHKKIAEEQAKSAPNPEPDETTKQNE